MVTIGIDPHKDTHSAVATDQVGRELAQQTEPALPDGYAELVVWARALDQDRVWVLEDCRHVSSGLERFLLDHGERVLRLPPQLMAGARRSVREPGKSDPIDALARLSGLLCVRPEPVVVGVSRGVGLRSGSSGRGARLSSCRRGAISFRRG
jgi:transposase